VSGIVRGAPLRAMRVGGVSRAPPPPGATGGVGARNGVGWSFTLPALYMIVMFIVLVGATASWAVYSGALRWLLYALVLAAVGYLAVRLVAGTTEPPGLGPRAPAPAHPLGELSDLRTILQRAQRGLAYSQHVFEARLRDAFLEKVRVLREVPEDALLAAMREPARVRALVGDETLARFVLEGAGVSRGDSGRALPKRADFAGRVRGLLERMEAWR